jgi:uncharacterized protein (TIGR02996 family)
VISLVVIAEDGTSRAQWFHKPEVTIGRAIENDVVLPSSAISKRHARLVMKDGKHILVDLKSTNGTFLNTRRLTSPLVVKETDKIYIGGFRIEVVPYDARASDDDDTAKVEIVELRLLANIASHEPGAREVYADWLDERGDAGRAEYVRLGDRLVETAGTTHAAHASRLEKLGERLDPEWRIKLARPLIEACDREHCPGDWGALTGSRDLVVRSCTRCRRQVHYCTDVATARSHVRSRDPVVLDLACERWPTDLDPLTPPFPTSLNPPITRPRSQTQPGIGPRTLPHPIREPMAWRPGCGGEPDVTD